VAFSKKEDQCLFLAAFIALKYPDLEMRAKSRRVEVPCFLAVLDALWNSRRRVVRWGVHQGLEGWEGLETGVCSLSRAVSLSNARVNHSSRSAGEGQVGAGGIRKFLMRGDSVTQSVSAHLGRLGLRIIVGEDRLIVIGTWSELVEGRETSHDLNNGSRRGFAKARSITEG